MKFTAAVRKKAKARIGLSGPSGSGKTYSALLLASGLGQRIAVIDTEKGPASLYAGLPGIPAFDPLALAAPYTPARCIEALSASAEAGYDVTIIDGITPEWSGVGGCLELVDQVANAKYRGNSWSAWNDITPRHRKFIDAMLNHPGHLIATMRSKTETAQEERNGKKVVVKMGMKAEQRDGIEYEFTAVLDIAHGGHYATASKDRTRLWVDHDPKAITADDGARLLNWLEGGAEDDPSERLLADIKNAATEADLLEAYGRATAAAKASQDGKLMADAKAETKARKAALEAEAAAAMAGSDA